MKQINSYIIEKLKIDKDSKFEEETIYVHPNERDAEQACDSFETDETMFCEYKNGRNNVGKVKLMLGNEHFYIKPRTAKSVTESLPDSPYVSNYIFKDLVKVGLGDSYVINAYQSRIDTTSRINNVRRKYHHFYFGQLGMIFKDKKEANTWLREAKSKYALSGEFKYKVITVEEAANMGSFIYGDSIGNVKFIKDY